MAKDETKMAIRKTSWSTIWCIILIAIGILWGLYQGCGDLIYLKGISVIDKGINRNISINNISFTRSIAEFDKMQGVLIRYPFGIPIEVIIEILKDVNMIIYCLISYKSYHQNQISSTIAEFESIDLNRIKFIILDTNSYWTRDYGPFFVHSYSNSYNTFGIVDFKYNRPYRANDNQIAYNLSTYFNLTYFDEEMVYNTGGNYMTDGCNIAASTQIIYTENDKYCNNTHMHHKIHNYTMHPKLPSCQYIDNVMQHLLGIKRFIVFDDPNKEYINHIDCWAKILSTSKILIKQFDEEDKRYDEMERIVEYWQNTLNSFEQKWEIYRIYTPHDEPYVNSFILNDKVFIPFMDNNDVGNQNAINIYKIALPNYKIIGFYANQSRSKKHFDIKWKSTDSIHCRMKGVPDFAYISKRAHDLCVTDSLG